MTVDLSTATASSSEYSNTLFVLSSTIRDLKKDRDLYHQVSLIDKRKVNALQTELNNTIKRDEGKQGINSNTSEHMLQIAHSWREEELLLQKRWENRLNNSRHVDNLIASQNELVRLLEKNKFSNIEFRNLSNGISAIHSGWKI